MNHTAPARKTDLDTLAMGLLLGCCAFWGFQQVLAKATIAEIAPVFQVWLRFAGACVLILIWCTWRGIALFERDDSMKAGLLAGVLFALEFACIYLGLSHTGASRLTVFLYTAPFWVAVLLPIWVKSEHLGRLQWAGLVIAFAGVVLALWAGLRSSTGSLLGDGFALAAGAFWGLTTVVIRASRLAQLKAEKTLFYQVAVSCFVLPWISLGLGERWNFQWSGFAWGSMLVQSAIGAFLSYLVWMWLLTRYPAAKMSAFAFLTPIFALIVSSIWLKEAITPSLLIALGSVIVGIILVNRKSRPAA